MGVFNLEAYLEDLKTLCAIDSGQGNAHGNAAVADFFEARFAALGLKTERKFCKGEDSAQLLTARNSDSEHIDLLLIAHMDTVFPVGTGAERPFAVDADNVGHGPGCIDCKGGCLLIEYLLRDLMQDGGCPFNLCVAFNSDEERGSRYSRPYFEELAKDASYCFVFEPGRAGDEFVSTRKGGANYLIRCHGIAAHSGVDPEKGASAILELSRWVEALYRMTDYETGTTLNVGRFQGGGDNGSVPDYAEFTLSFRYLDPEAFAALKAELARMQAQPFDPRTRIEVEEVSLRPAMIPSAKTHELLRMLKDAGDSLGLPVAHITTGGASDGNFVAHCGVATLDGCGPCGAKLHTAGEYIKVASIEQRLDLMRALIRRLFPA